MASASFTQPPANQRQQQQQQQHQSANAYDSWQRSSMPVTTGSSVLAVKYNGGVMLAADTGAAYGSLMRYRDIRRVIRVNDTTVTAASGDIADMQNLRNVIENHVIGEGLLEDGVGYTPASLHCWLTRVMYNRRSRIDPLWNTFIVAGIEKGEAYLGYVNMLGVAYKEDCLATGFGAHLAIGMLREALEKAGEAGLSEEAAGELIKACLRTLYYRDCRAYNRYQLANVRLGQPASVADDLVVEGDWTVARLMRSYET